jgi:hypothetical protein
MRRPRTIVQTVGNTADLLWRPTPVKKSENMHSGEAVDIELGFWFGSAPRGLAALLSNMRAVCLATGCIAQQLTGDG